MITHVLKGIEPKSRMKCKKKKKGTCSMTELVGGIGKKENRRDGFKFGIICYFHFLINTNGKCTNPYPNHPDMA